MGLAERRILAKIPNTRQLMRTFCRLNKVADICGKVWYWLQKCAKHDSLMLFYGSIGPMHILAPVSRYVRILFLAALTDAYLTFYLPIASKADPTFEK